jgi:hypothetical protein
VNGVTTLFAIAAMLAAAVGGVFVADMIRRRRQRNHQGRADYRDR